VLEELVEREVTLQRVEEGVGGEETARDLVELFAELLSLDIVEQLRRLRLLSEEKEDTRIELLHKCEALVAFGSAAHSAHGRAPVFPEDAVLDVIDGELMSLELVEELVARAAKAEHTQGEDLLQKSEKELSPALAGLSAFLALEHVLVELHELQRVAEEAFELIGSLRQVEQVQILQCANALLELEKVGVLVRGVSCAGRVPLVGVLLDVVAEVVADLTEDVVRQLDEALQRLARQDLRPFPDLQPVRGEARLIDPETVERSIGEIFD